MTIRTLLIATAALSAVAGAAAAQSTANATAPVKANIVTPLSVTLVEGTELNFGTLSRTGAPAVSVVVDQLGALGATTGVTPSGTTDAAEFTILGPASQAITVSSDPITFSGITVTPNVGDGSEQLSASGSLTIGVGGTLTIPAGTAVTAGLKSGTLTVTASYN